MTAKARVEEIDIIKALGILLMVLGHAGTPGTNWIYLFHMAVFVIASGYCFRPKHSETLLKGVLPFIGKRIWQLWVPYAIWQSVFVLLNNWLLKINVYTSNPLLFEYVNGSTLNISVLMPPLTQKQTLNAVKNCLLFSNLTPLGGALWFLQLIFFVSVSYCVVDYLVRKIVPRYSMLVQAALSVGLLIVGSRCKGNEWMLSLGRAASCYFMFFLGCFLRQHAGVVERMNWKVFLPCGIVSLAVLLYCNTLHQSSFVSVYLITNRYPNPLFLAVCSVAGWILLYSAAFFIRKVPGKRFIMWIGKRTRAVMIFHFAAFKLVAARIVSVYHLPAFCMAAHTHLYGDRGSWWMAYTLVGLAVPLLLSFCFSLLLYYPRSAIRQKLSARFRKASAPAP